MARPVKRAYDASARQAAAAERRQRILSAAHALFVDIGYSQTTMTAIAERADVALDTVYAAVGTKPVVLTTLVEHAISGVGGTVDAEDRAYVTAIRAESSARRKLEIYAAAVRAINDRLGPLFVTLASAAEADADAAEVWHRIAERRAVNMRRFADDLAATGQLRAGIDLGEVADAIWAMNSAEFHDLLVRQRSWSPDAYEAWLADSWCRLLLEP